MEKIKKVPTYVWILAVIMLVGIFLRTYNLHSWLKFRDDQARDASLVSSVVDGEASWPMMGAYMSYSGDGDHVETNSFHLGPIYYYFQITAGKIFGNYADKLAYPDVFFGILSILLLYMFLRIYFQRNLSLGIAGLYAISSYFVQYSRFAWNTNLIPFFVLLFLFSLYKLLEHNEETDWKWPSLLGIAIGVGVQLHVIVMAVFFSLTFLVFIFSLKKNIGAWNKWVLVLLLIVILNATQIVSELKTNFNNTKILLNSTSRDSGGGSGKLTLVKNDLDCHIEANAYFLSSYGSSNCTYGFLSPENYMQIRTKNVSKFMHDLTDVLAMLAAVAFAGLGYFLLIQSGKNEKDEHKRYFLRIILAYIAITFVIMIPLSTDKFNDLRYLTPIFFTPFLLTGFIVKFCQEKISKRSLLLSLVGSSFLLLIYANGRSLMDQVVPLANGSRTCSSHSTTLGELEPVAKYLASKSNGNKIYFGGDKAFRVVYTPLAYILKKYNVDSEEIGVNPDLVESKDQTYIISCKAGLKKHYPYKEIGDITVYQINK